MKIHQFRSIASFLSLLILCLISLSSVAQVQTIRGQVLDADALIPLPGATVVLLGTDPVIGTSTDLDGYFRLENIPVGRVSLEVRFIGYEPSVMEQVQLTSGKELVLEIALRESTEVLDEVLIEADNGSEALNEMATVSSRSFSVEETRRYAASTFDPARMAMNFAGVVSSGDDVMNEISIRGNSPRSMMWRLEGIEIPNPNHFGAMGSSGGGISMLSSSTLGRSDFYTGAFPAEFGNANSGVFDLNFRKGNNQQREYALMVGLLGVEAAAEGPFKQGGRSSYLINYRYSTLGLLSEIMEPLGDILPRYQDLSFKVELPTENAGTFSIWGLGGENLNTLRPDADSSLWVEKYDHEGFEEAGLLGVGGISHRYILSDQVWMRNVISASADRYRDKYYYLLPEQNYARDYYDSTNFLNTAIRASSMINIKVNARSSVRTGIIYSQLGYRYDYQNRNDSTGIWTRYLSGQGNTGFAQAYAQWKYRLSDDWTLNTGLHASHLFLNSQSTIEPRMSVEYDINPKQRISFALGLHSRPEHVSTYFLEEAGIGSEQLATVNQDLEIPKSAHAVISYKRNLAEDLDMQVEAYYQHLYDVAVEVNEEGLGATLNAINIWDLVGADSSASIGLGRNYGIDVGIEKRFSRQYYILFSGSLFRSQYRPADSNWYSTRFDRLYASKLLAGKEWTVGKKRVNSFGLNGKVVMNGGNRYHEVDLEASCQAGERVYTENYNYAAQTAPYMRLDFGVSYTINRPKTTHTILLDVQNVTNRLNSFWDYYDSETGNIESVEQLGLFPFFNYRVEF